MAIQRLFVTKRESFNQEAQRMLQTLQQELSYACYRSNHLRAI